MDHNKRNEWMEFRAKHPTQWDWKDVYNWVKDPKSLFHDSVKWSEKEIREDYYRKICQNLGRRNDQIYCNTTTSSQILAAPFRPTVPTYDAKYFENGVMKRVNRTMDKIEKNEDELKFVRAAIWGRLRRVVSDMATVNKQLPEFSEIYEFLRPRVISEMTSVETRGAAAQ